VMADSRLGKKLGPGFLSSGGSDRFARLGPLVGRAVQGGRAERREEGWKGRRGKNRRARRGKNVLCGG